MLPLRSEVSDPKPRPACARCETSALAQSTPWQRDTNHDHTSVEHHGRRTRRFANHLLTRNCALHRAVATAHQQAESGAGGREPRHLRAPQYGAFPGAGAVIEEKWAKLGMDGATYVRRSRKIVTNRTPRLLVDRLTTGGRAAEELARGKQQTPRHSPLRPNYRRRDRQVGPAIPR